MPHEVADGVLQFSPVPQVNSFAVRGGNGWTLVDAGLGPVAGILVRQLRRAGIRPGDVERIVLTHAHLDHAGGAEAVRTAFGAREVLVGAADLADARAGRNASSETPSALARSPLPAGGYAPLPTAGEALLDTPLHDDRRMVLVATPGHTMGHLAVHLPDDRVVLGGDAVFNVFRLTRSPGFLCSDVPASTTSIETLAALDHTTLLLAHGGPVDDDPSGRLRALLAATSQEPT